MSNSTNDRNLLFGIQALQMDFVSRDALIAGMNAWVLAKHRGLGEILVEQGGLSPECRDVLEKAVSLQVAKHGNDVEKSLAAVAAPAALKDDLRSIGDRDLEASLVHITSAFRRADDPWLTQAPSVGESTSIGSRFRILRHHKNGGLGQVSVARDGELHREVALKEIRDQYSDDVENRLRFVREAEITGGLEHPGIVPVYGLGQYPDGRPYYAMRFIRGDDLKEAVTRFHRQDVPSRDPGERMLELRKLLRRFLDVCNAISYAHSRGVLHRDLKPGNIMLGRYGETLVVDWGLAKSFESKGGDPTLDARSDPRMEPRLEPSLATLTAETQMGAAVGTPQYMSPEQAEGRLDLLGPASDIYSLGATLYYLLVGKAPFEDPDVSNVLYKVRHSEFRHPREVKSSVPAPLDAICMKAMAFDPKDRYASPVALADDIEHWLADEPVGAFPEPWSARWARTLRRHKTLFAGGIALLLTAVVTLSVSTVVINRARNEAEENHQRAAKNFDMARKAVDQYLTMIGRDPRLKAHGLEPLRQDLLKTARQFYDEFVNEKESGPDTEHSRGDAYLHLGYITSETGSKQEAIDLYTKALAIYRGLAVADPKSDSFLADVGEVQFTLGTLDLAVGKLSEAEAACQASIAVLAPIAAEHPEVTRYQNSLAKSQSILGGTYQALGRPKDAETAFLAALQIRAKLLADHPDSDDFRSDFAVSHNNLGAYYQTNGRAKEAETEFQAALELRRGLAEKYPHIVSHQSELARIHYNLGLLYQASDQPTAAVGRGRRRFKEAEAAYDAAAALYKRLSTEHPEVSQYQVSLADCYNNLANLYRAIGREKDMEASYKAALNLYANLADLNPRVTDYQAQTAAIQNNLGLLYKARGDFPAAEKAYFAAVKIRTELAAAESPLPANQAELGRIEFNLGTLYKDTGRSEEARAAYLRAVEIRRKLADPASAPTSNLSAAQADLAESENELGVVLSVLRQNGEADASFHASLEICQTLVAAHPEDVRNQARLADVFNSLGAFYAAIGKPKDAESALNSAAEIWQRLAAQGPPDPQHDRELARVRNNQGNLLRDAKQFDKAEAAYRSSLEIRQRLVDQAPGRVEYSAELAGLAQSMAKFYESAGRKPDAIASYRQAAAIYAKLAAEHPDAPAFKTRAAEADRLLQAAQK